MATELIGPAIKIITNPKKTKRAIQDGFDYAGDVIKNRPARDVYTREIKKQVKRTAEDVKSNWRDVL